MLTAELSANWLPRNIVAGDGNARRLQLILAGTFWDAATQLPAGMDTDQFQRWFLPWRWKKVIGWQLYLAGTSKPITIGAVAMATGDYQPDADAVAGHYAKEILKEIWPGNTLRAEAVVGRARTDNTVETLELDDTTPVTAPAAGGPPAPAWLKGYLAQKAVELPPLNVQLQMAWVTEAFASSAQIPAQAHIAILPVFEDGNPWQALPGAVNWLPQTQWLKGTYPASTNGQALQIFCPTVVLPAVPVEGTAPPADPLDCANLTVSDTDEWLSTLGSHSAAVFDLPRWLVDWIKKIRAAKEVDGSAEWRIKAELYRLADGTPEEKERVASFLNGCRQYLTAASRDLCGFGRIDGPDRLSLAKLAWLSLPAKKATDWPLLQKFLETFDKNLSAAPEKFTAWWNEILAAVSEQGGVVSPLSGWDQIELKTAGKFDPAKVAAFTHAAIEEQFAKAFAYLDFVRDPENAKRLIVKQWEKAKSDPAFPIKDFDLAAVNGALANIPDPARFQAQGYLSFRPGGAGKQNYWQSLFPAREAALNETGTQKYITDHLRAAVTDSNNGAWVQRFGAAQTFLHPAIVSDPFKETFAGSSLRNGFFAYVDSAFAWEQQGGNEIAPAAGSVPNTLFPHREETYPAQPPLRITVGMPAADSDEADTDEENSADDKAGLLLFCRADKKGTAPWQSLNVASVDLVDTSEPQPSVFTLAHSYLVPSPLGRQDGVHATMRRFDNENPSIVASPDVQDAAPPGEHEQPPPPYRIKLTLPKQHKACALHYGKEYSLCGAMVTNAGVLASPLRKGAGAESLCIPDLRPDSSGFLDLGPLNHVAHSQKRRVPVGPVQLRRVGANKSEPLFPIPGPPARTATNAVNPAGVLDNNRAVRPIACELPEWRPRGQNGAKTSAPDQSLCLIFPENKERKDGLFGSATYEIAKPSTPYWNWFEWQNDWTTCPRLERVTEWTNETVSRNNPKYRRDTFVGLDDPAVEEVLYCKVEELFPEQISSEHFVKYTRQEPKKRNAKITLQVKSAPADSTQPIFSPTNGVITVAVPQGKVIRLRLYSLVKKTEFKASGGNGAPLPRFHDFMAGLPGSVEVTNPQGNQPCIAVSPVELWVESARQWNDAILKKDIAAALWHGLRLTPPHAYSLVWKPAVTDITDEKQFPKNGVRTVAIADAVPIGDAKRLMHFRIFNADREVAVDLTEKQLPLAEKERESQIQELRDKLNDLGSSGADKKEKEAEIIEWVIALTGWKRDRKLHAHIDRSVTVKPAGDFKALAQVGRLDVWHQVWRWDGREVDATLLEAMLDEDDALRDPAGEAAVQKESHSVLWDGAAFPTRPEYSHRSRQATLGVWRKGPNDPRQEIFSQDLRDDLRSVYYRVAVQGFSRYEAVFGSAPVVGRALVGKDSAEADVEAPWRRTLTKAVPPAKVPKPAIRFALPLTRDVTTADGDPQSAASIMFVLDDTWFAEGGLAEDFEVGVRILTKPVPPGETAPPLKYYNAGFDPTLAPTALPQRSPKPPKTAGSANNGNGQDPPLSLGEVEQIEGCLLGPYGLTHDYAARVPKLRGSSFILRVPLKSFSTVAASNTVDECRPLPWFMCEVTARRVLRRKAVSLPHGSDENNLVSAWSAPAWVQFIPDTELLLPDAWRGPCALVGAQPITIETPTQGEAILHLNLPRYDRCFEAGQQRWLVLSKRITDIQGQPAERYLATFVDESLPDEKQTTFVCRDGDIASKIAADPSPAYLRLVLVRRRPVNDKDPAAAKRAVQIPTGKVWDSLFAPDTEADAPVLNDATRGMPIVTGRVAVTLRRGSNGPEQ